ncbi:MAG: formyltransferase [Syntrophorhabdales bacterium]
MKAVVLAYHEIGYVCLQALLDSAISVSALFTHRDDPGEEIWFRTPRVLAEKHHIPVFEPASLGDPAWIEHIRRLEPDYLFSFYYRNMLPREILDIPRIAPLNLHGSLLPKFRGRCPVNWVLIEGERRTGVTLHVMEVKPDAGEIVARKEVGITFEETAHTLSLKLAAAAAALMRETIPALETGAFERRPQVGASSYYGGRRPEDGAIDWDRGAMDIYNLIRAVTHPYPGAFTFLDGRKLFIWRASPEEGAAEGRPGMVVSTEPLLVKTGRGVLRVTSLQVEGEGEMGAEQFLSLHDLDMKFLGGRF